MNNNRVLSKAYIKFILMFALANNSLAFQIFDGTLYTNKPNLEKFGVKPIHIIYEKDLKTSGKLIDPLIQTPSPLFFMDLSRKLKQKPAPVVIDVESWPINGRDPVTMKISAIRYERLASDFAKNLPNVEFGYFTVVPVQDFIKNQALPGSKTYKEWQSDNDRVAPIAKIVTAVFIGGYTYTDNIKTWKTTIEQQVSEAKRIYDNGPIYVFIWPQYFDHAPALPSLQSKFISKDFWLFQLQTLEKLVDGVVIWGGWDSENRRPFQWDSQAPWWISTVHFLNNSASNGNTTPTQ